MSHFALIVDNPTRDLKGLVLLGCELASRGHKCSLVPMGLSQELFALLPDVVVLNYARTHSADLIKRLDDEGILVTVLDTEGGVFANLDHICRTFPRERYVREKVKRYFCWGQSFADVLVKQGYYSEEQVAVTGSPRFDLYAEKWNQVAKQLAPTQFEQPMVLINSTFPLSNPRFQSREAEVQLLVNHFGHAENVVRAWQSVQDESIRAMVSLAKKLAYDFPSVTFVFRPHPFEGLAIYQDAFSDIGNIHLGNAGTVDGWILQASAVIHRNCSTAIEAGFCGVPALLPRWIPVSAEVPSSAAVSDQIKSYEELCQRMHAILADNYACAKDLHDHLRNIEIQWFKAIDGEASKRVAEILIRISDASGTEDEREADRPQNRHRGIAEMMKSLIEPTLTPLRWLARRIDPRSGLRGYRESAKRFTCTDVLQIVNAFQSIDFCKQRFGRINVHSMSRESNLLAKGSTCESVVLANRNQ